MKELEEDISKTQTMLERKENEIENRLEEKARVEGVSERADLASDAREAVQDFREELAKKKLQKLESRLSERYITLSNKGDFYDEIQIDEETLDISIRTIHGNKKPQTELSAGERQIFATSLLWALAEISDRPLPFIIDTPLGRLDNDHRDNLITHFFPEAGHQVIIFSTDTEIDDNQYRKLEDSISQAYHLEYDEADGRRIPSRRLLLGDRGEGQPKVDGGDHVMSQNFNRITIGNDATNRLKMLKANTGMTPNYLCRIGFCYSLNEPRPPNPKEYDNEGKTFNRYTLLGEHDALYMALLKERLIQENKDPETRPVPRVRRTALTGE
ncbi:MAG: DndE family protein [Natrialbaceae archaeon]|nr:DndE family protein [Natrialbaceae archaeon]